MAEKTRVDFNAPDSLVERADAVADLLDISRTQLLVRALRDELDDLAADESFRRELRRAYYAGRVGFEAVERLLGTEEALRIQLLAESLGRDPPEPHLDDDPPVPDEFYDGAVPEWTPDGPGRDGESDDANPDERR